jgi:hypothetical protein
MRKYINASKLIHMIQNDEVLVRELSPFLQQRLLTIIDECPNVGSAFDLPIEIGAQIITAAGKTGVVESCYVGGKGVQRIFARMNDGEKLSFKPKDIGMGVFLSDPKISPSERLESQQADFTSEFQND